MTTPQINGLIGRMVYNNASCFFQCSPYQAVTGKINHLKQQQATVPTTCNLLMVY